MKTTPFRGNSKPLRAGIFDGLSPDPLGHDSIFKN